MLRRLLSQLFARKAAQRRKDPAWQSAIDFRPRIEQLEDRSMMSVATITATDNTADELNESTGMFTVTLDSPAVGDVTVNLEFSGTATFESPPLSGLWTDVSFPGFVNILDGQTTGTATIIPLPDNLVEGPETVICTIVAGTGYTVGTSNSDTVTVADDPPVVRVETRTLGYAESDGTMDHYIHLSLSGGREGGVAVTLAPSGTAIAGTDFTSNWGAENVAVYFNTDQTELSFWTYGIADHYVEGTETATYTLVPSADYVIDEEADSVVISLYDTTDSAEDDTVVDTCPCGCEGVSTSVVGSRGSFVADTAEGQLRYMSSNGETIVAADAHFEEGADEADVIEVVPLAETLAALAA